MPATAQVKGDKLIIEVDVSAKAVKAAGLSKSGKNKLVYSSRGNIAVECNIPGLRFGLNVIADDNSR